MPMLDLKEQLCLRLVQTKQSNGERINNIQITENPRFPVFLSMKDLMDQSRKEKCIDESSGEILETVEFCERLKELAEIEEKMATQKAAEIKEISDLIDRLKNVLNAILDIGKGRHREEYFGPDASHQLSQYVQKWKAYRTGGVFEGNRETYQRVEGGPYVKSSNC